MLISALLMYLALNLPSGAVIAMVVVMGTGWMFSFMYYPSVYAAIQDVVQPALRGTTMAPYFLAMYLFGGSFGPVLVGKLSDYFVRRAMAGGANELTESFRSAGLHSAMYAIPVFSALLAAVLRAQPARSRKICVICKLWMLAPETLPRLKPE